MKRLALATACATALASTPLLAQDSGLTDMSSAKSIQMKAPDGSDRGTVSIVPTPHGLLFEAQLTGLTPVVHAFHIHETGQCGDDFSAAGGHYNPTDKDHGYLAENGPHAGDMPNFTAGEDGSATFSTFNPMVTMTGGEAPLDDSDGSALMVHGGADDYRSQPAGAAGDRVACGVVFPAG